MIKKFMLAMVVFAAAAEVNSMKLPPTMKLSSVDSKSLAMQIAKQEYCNCYYNIYDGNPHSLDVLSNDVRQTILKGRNPKIGIAHEFEEFERMYDPVCDRALRAISLNPTLSVRVIKAVIDADPSLLSELKILNYNSLTDSKAAKLIKAFGQLELGSWILCSTLPDFQGELQSDVFVHIMQHLAVQ